MKKKILIIEDNLEVRENTAEILELSNYEVLQAADGKEGVRAAKKHLPDLIVCDIMMPEMDGYEVLYMLGKDHQTESIPFIFLTAKAEKEDFRHGMSLGADDYLTKPFDDMELLSSIERRLSKYEKLKANDGREPGQFISSLEKADLESSAKHERQYNKNDVIFREGDYPHYLYFIDSGKVKTYKISEEGKEFILDIYKEGDYFAYQSLLQNKNQMEFAAAMEKTTLKLISRDDFEKIIHEDKTVARLFIKLLANNVAEKESELLHLAYDTVRKRVADNLLKLDEAYNGAGSFKVARNDLAGMVGTATESVIRILSEFKKDGIIAIETNGIKILKKEELQQIKW